MRMRHDNDSAASRQRIAGYLTTVHDKTRTWERTDALERGLVNRHHLHMGAMWCVSFGNRYEVIS